MKYVIYKEAIDDYGEGDTIKFDKLKDAQSWWKEWFGNSFEYGSGYIVYSLSAYGSRPVTKVWTSLFSIES